MNTNIISTTQTLRLDTRTLLLIFSRTLPTTELVCVGGGELVPWVLDIFAASELLLPRRNAPLEFGGFPEGLGVASVPLMLTDGVATGKKGRDGWEDVAGMAVMAWPLIEESW